jgi:hypothetical protein
MDWAPLSLFRSKRTLLNIYSILVIRISARKHWCLVLDHSKTNVMTMRCCHDPKFNANALAAQNLVWVSKRRANLAVTPCRRGEPT